MHSYACQEKHGKIIFGLELFHSQTIFGVRSGLILSQCLIQRVKRCETLKFSSNFLIFLTGYTGNRFFTFPQFGHTSKIESTSALCDFTNNYQFTKSTEFSPLPFYHASLHGERPGNEIYPRNTGLVPSYKGHVPGLQHR